VHLALSPDEHSVAAERLESRTGNGTIWIIDADRNLSSRLTQDPSWSLLPLWSKDGRRVIFASGRTGESYWFARSADGSGTDEVLPVPSGLTNANDWMPDGRLVFTSQLPTPTILTMPLTGSAQVAPLIDKDFQGSYGKISPDGRWLAYMSAESGKVDIFVRALSGPGRWAISRNGGLQPRWRRDGKELYFLTPDWSLMAVPITTTATSFSAGEPVPLHIRAQADTLGARYVYDVAGLGQRFLVNYAAETDQSPAVSVIVNWTALLRK